MLGARRADQRGDLLGGEKVAGGRWVKVAAPIEQIPLFVRAGSIVPLGKVVQSTASPQPIEEIRVYPGQDGEFAGRAD